MALRCAQASEARRHPRTGQHERKLQIKAGDLRRFKRRSVDHRGSHVSGEPRSAVEFFHLGRHASFTDIAKYFYSSRFKQGARVAHCTLQVMFLFSVPDTAARRYGFPGDLSMMTPPRRYLLISPCRDEAQYLRRTLDSVAAQSVPPALWVVVDDGSTDDTPTILEAYARRLPYLRVVRRADRGRRQVGPGVIAAFYAGLETVRLEDFDYAVSWTWIWTCRSATSSC